MAAAAPWHQAIQCEVPNEPATWSRFAQPSVNRKIHASAVVIQRSARIPHPRIADGGRYGKPPANRLPVGIAKVTVAGGCGSYSYRKATMGSIFMARRAGI